MLGKKLERQLSRYLETADIKQNITATVAYLRNCSDFPSENINPIENFYSLLEIIDSSYTNYEDKLNVAERNILFSSQELVSANRAINSIMNSLKQGFLTFDKNGICNPIYSAECLKLLEEVPSGKHITKLLKLNEEQAANFKSLLEIAFNKTTAMPFSSLFQLAPKKFEHSEGLHISIDYKPETNKSGKLESIVLIATDITAQVLAEKKAKEQQNIFEAIERVLRNRRAFGSYMNQMLELLNFLEKNEKNYDIIKLGREIHTLKGGAGLFKLENLSKLLHNLEEALQPNKSYPENYLQIKQEIEKILYKFNELLTTNVLELEKEHNFDKKNVFKFANYLAENNLTDLREKYIYDVCTESLIENIRFYDYLLNDIAKILNKSINPILFTGQDVMIVVNNYKATLDSLVHIFRNIMDHGIESPEERKQIGKNPTGNIEVNLCLNNENDKKIISIKITDDGQGIDAKQIREKLKLKYQDKNWDSYSDYEIIQQIFMPEFSSKDKANQYSGRGIGLNAVKDEIEKIGGNISATTNLGRGTEFNIKLPYILDI